MAEAILLRFDLDQKLRVRLSENQGDLWRKFRVCLRIVFQNGVPCMKKALTETTVSALFSVGGR